MRRLLIASLFGGAALLGIAGMSAPAQAQFFFGGRNYCFYPDGWHGPGYYWCGYAFRRGFGWGGPTGWHGWSGRGPGPGGRPGFVRGGPGHGPVRGPVRGGPGRGPVRGAAHGGPGHHH